jgi:hypothetical protein
MPGGGERVSAAPPGEEAVGWSSLLDTAEAVRRQNTPSSSRRAGPSSRRPAQRQADDKRRLWWMLGGGAGLVFLGVVFLLWAVFRSGSTEKSLPIVGPGGKPVLFVNATGDNGAYVSINKALEVIRRKPEQGGRIILQSDVADYARVTQPGVTIEAERGRTVVWRPPANLPPNTSRLLTILNAPDFHLEGNIILDAENRMVGCMSLAGSCPGVVVNGVTFKGFVNTGLQVNNCVGGGNQQMVVLTRLVFETTKPTQVGLFFDHDPKIQAQFPRNGNMEVRDCEKRGPGQLWKSSSDEAIKGVQLPAGLPAPRKP